MTLDDLRKIAEAATPGEWVAFGTDVGHVTDKCNCGPMGIPGHEAYCGIEGPIAQAGEADAEFIATFNPQRVLELLARRAEHEQAVENMSTKTDDLLSKLAAVEKLHTPDEGHNPECHCGIPPNDGRDCKVCQADAWPCETIKAARGK